MLDRVLGDEVYPRDGAELILPPGAGDPLFELGGVPRQVAIDDDAGMLEVEPDATRVGAEEEPAVRVLAEGEDLGAALPLRDAAGVPGAADAVLVRPFADARSFRSASGPRSSRRPGARDRGS